MTTSVTDDFAGQLVLVTGGARGIGAAAAQVFAERGAKVVLLDRDELTAQSTAESLVGDLPAVGMGLDVTDEARVADALGLISNAYGAPSVLVNNAGTTGPARPLWETPTDYFTAMLQVHLMGTFFCCRETIPRMLSEGYGRIVNVASVAGKEGNAGSGAYSAAKAGVIALTKSLGKELATTGVTVNVVTPGVIDTPLVQSATPEHIARLESKIPMGRRGRPREVAEMIAWAASPRCSFTTGSVFDVSGGRTTY